MATIEEIIPGKTYPSMVTVTETDGKVARFMLQSYQTGMYCAIYFNGELAGQSGGDNKRFISKLKRDLLKALTRKATVEIDSIRNVVASI